MNFETSSFDLNFKAKQHAFLVGIKGVGMTALAICLQEIGLVVSGADQPEEFVTDVQLAKQSIPVSDFHDAQIPDNTNFVIYSGANQGSANPLVQQAKRQGKTCLNLAQAVGLLSKLKKTVVVAGVGGKSTTSAWLAWILEVDEQRPSFSVGVGNIPNLESPAHFDLQSELLIVEADEYVSDPKTDLTPRFLYLQPKHAICTSLTFDHPDVYRDYSETKQAFSALFAKLQPNSWLIVNGDQPDLLNLAKQCIAEVITVGLEQHNDVRIENITPQSAGTSFCLVSSMWGTWKLTTLLPGEHNVKNAAYSATMAYFLGAKPESIAQAIGNFKGVQRRFEFVGQTKQQISCYDDYAHHPHELIAIAQTLTKWFPNQKTVIAFEPHTFSRTKALFAEFVTALTQFSGDVILLPIFASAREEIDPTVSSEQLVAAVRKQKKNVHYLSDYQALLKYIEALEPNTMFLTLGAGTVYQVYEQLEFI